MSSAIVLTGGFLALLAVGPALETFGPEAVFGGIAAFQTLAATVAVKVAYGRLGGVRPRGPDAADQAASSVLSRSRS